MHTSLKLQMLSAAAALAIGGGVAQADYADTVLDDNPIAYYRLGDADSTGNAANLGSNAGITGSYEYVGTGPESASLHFGQTGPATITDGSAVGINQSWVRDSNTDYSYLNVTAGTGGTATWSATNYSVELWFKPELAFDKSGVQYVVNRKIGTTGQLGDGFLIAGDYYTTTYENSNTTYNEKVTASSSFGGLLEDIEGGQIALTSTGTLASSTNKVTLGNWYHAVLTRSNITVNEGTENEAETSILTLYISELLADGTAGWSETIWAIQDLDDGLASVSNANFGIRTSHPDQYVFGGDISEVALYNDVLSKTQADAHFTAAIPEPGSLLLFGAGATMLLYRRRTVS